MHDLHERYGWVFFLWRWLTRLIVLPITVLVVSRSALASAATHAATISPTAPASGATSLSAPAATALWATTATVTGLLVGQLGPDGAPPEPAGAYHRNVAR